jgi:hypothetical protein
MGSGNVVGASARVLDVVRRLVALSQVLHSRECLPQFREHQADGLAGQGGDERGRDAGDSPANASPPVNMKYANASGKKPARKAAPILQQHSWPRNGVCCNAARSGSSAGRYASGMSTRVVRPWLRTIHQLKFWPLTVRFIV